MSASRFICCTTFFAILAGCYGSHATPAAGALGASPSWTRVATSQGPFIYGAANSSVNIFTYAGQQVGSLTGFQAASGICSDNSGDIYVLDSERDLIYEYLSGGTLPVDVLDDRYQTPSGCAVDSTTGNLAVVNLLAAGRTATPDVVVFPSGSYQTPIAYTAPNIVSYSFCAYDPAGNLYVDGIGAKRELELAVLRSGSSQFVPVPLSGVNNHHHKPAAVQWDGQYLAIGDRGSDDIYRVAVSGSYGTIVQTVPIRGWYHHDVVGFDIVSNKLLFPLSNKLLFFKYPAGGRRITGFFGSVGSAITVTNAQ
jgi:hypothetical protein